MRSLQTDRYYGNLTIIGTGREENQTQSLIIGDSFDPGRYSSLILNQRDANGDITSSSLINDANGSLVLDQNNKFIIKDDTIIDSNLHQNNKVYFGSQVDGSSILSGDTNLYRQMQDTLKTDDNLVVQLNTRIDGQAFIQDGIYVSDGESIYFGSAFTDNIFTAGDQQIYRSAQNTLRTNSNFIIDRTLTVSDNTFLSKNLNVTGYSVFDNNINVNANQTLGNQSTVTNIIRGTVNISDQGYLTTINGGLKIQQSADFDNNVNIDGSQVLNNALDVYGITTLRSNLNVLGNTVLGDSNTDTNVVRGTVNISDPQKQTTIKGNLTVNEQQTFNNTLQVKGNSTLGDQNTDINTIRGVVDISDPSKQTTIKGTLNVDEQQSFDSTVLVSGQTTLNSTATINGQALLNNNLTVKGNTVLGDQATDIQDINGVVNLSNAGVKTTVEGNLEVQQQTNLKSTLNVDGQSIINNNLTVNGNSILGNQVTDFATIRGTVDISDSTYVTTVNGMLDVNEHADFLSTVSIANDLDVSGNLIIRGNTSLGNADTDIQTILGTVNLSNIGKLTTIKGNLKTDGLSTFSNAVTINGQTTINNNLTVTGNTVIGDTTTDVLTVNGAVNLSNSGVGTTVRGLFTANEQVDLLSTLSVSGWSIFDNTVDINGITSIHNNLNVSGNTTLGNAQTDVQDINGIVNISNTGVKTIVEGNMDINEQALLKSTLTVNGLSTLNNNLVVNGNTILGNQNTNFSTIRGTVNISDTGYSTTVNGIFKQKQQATFDSSVAISGQQTLSGGTIINGVTQINNNLTVSGNTTLGDQATDTARIRGAITASDAGYKTDILGSLDVTQQTLLKSTLNVNGNTDLDGTLNVDGSQVLQNTLDVNGNTFLNANLDVDGSALLRSALNVYGNSTLGNQNTNIATIRGIVNISDSTKQTTVKGNLTVNEQQTFNSNVSIKGNTVLGDAATDTTTIRGIINLSDPSVQTTIKGTLNVDEQQILNNNLTVNGISRFNNNVSIIKADTDTAEIDIMGSDQGTGVVYVGQSQTHGGGIFYNGDASPSYASGETQDKVSFFRRTAGNNYVVFDYLHSSNNVDFKGSINVASNISQGGTISGTIDWSNLINVPDPVITLTGDVTGSQVMTNLGNATITQVVGNDTHSHSNSTITSVDWSKLLNVPSPVITLAGDVTGSQTMNTLGNVTITQVVADNSHNHDNSTITSVDWSKLLNVPDPTITLTGDVTGSQTMTNLGSINITQVVQDDSHTHDGRYYTESEQDARFVNVTGDTLTGNLTFTDDGEGILWSRNTDNASIKFYNVSDADTNSRLEFSVGDNSTEFFRWVQATSSDTTELMKLVPDNVNNGLTYRGNIVWHQGNDGSNSGLDQDLLDGQHGSYYLDWANVTNKPDPTVTLTGDVTGSQTMTDLNSITITQTVGNNSHSHDNSTITSLDWSKLLNVPDPVITLAGDLTGSQTMTNLGNVTITQTVVDDSHNHDGRYYTESEQDSRFVNVTGDSLTGSLLYSGDQDYKGIYWGSKFEDQSQHDGSWAYIRQGQTAGQIEIGSDNIIDIYSTDTRTLALSISTTGKTLDAKGGLLENGVQLSSKYLGLHANADSQSKLYTQRTISLAGDVTGSQSFDGSQNISISAAVQDDSHSHSNSTITSVDWSKLLNVPDPTITLTGDVTGSQTMTNLGSITITTTVANDSHTHDTRYYTESEADSRFVNATGDTITGTLSVSNASSWYPLIISNTNNNGTDCGGLQIYPGGDSGKRVEYTAKAQGGFRIYLQGKTGDIMYSDFGTVYVNGNIRATKVYGAVYNDYAEYRSSTEPIDFGYVQIEDEKGNVIKCNEDRSKKVQGVSTDTLGFQIGKQKDTDTPIAVAGRVLVYQVNKNKLKVGDQVCSTKEGKVRKMKWWEKIFFPEQIVGYVSEFPSYDVWGSDNINVNGRIWIRI